MDNKLLCTEGGWRVSHNGNDVETDDSAALGICAMYANEHTEANAHLIAASKDLYNALLSAKEIIERISSEYSMVAEKHSSYTMGENKKITDSLKKANPNFK